MIDLQDYRRALGQFATGVAVVTACDSQGHPIGLTISSFNSVSLDPPLILFSIDRKLYSLSAMLEAKGYAVNVLSRGQEQISNQFARALSNKWTDVQHELGHAGCPLIRGALAHFECEPYAHYDGGDHVIFVGRVTRFAIFSRGEEQPLVFFRGRYHSLQFGNEVDAVWPLSIHY